MTRKELKEARARAKSGVARYVEIFKVAAPSEAGSPVEEAILAALGGIFTELIYLNDRSHGEIK